MKRVFGMLTVLAVIAVMLAGCTNPIEPDAFDTGLNAAANNGNGNGNGNGNKAATRSTDQTIYLKG